MAPHDRAIRMSAWWLLRATVVALTVSCDQGSQGDSSDASSADLAADTCGKCVQLWRAVTIRLIREDGPSETYTDCREYNSTLDYCCLPPAFDGVCPGYLPTGYHCDPDCPVEPENFEWHVCVRPGTRFGRGVCEDEDAHGVGSAPFDCRALSDGCSFPRGDGHEREEPY